MRHTCKANTKYVIVLPNRSPIATDGEYKYTLSIYSSIDLHQIDTRRLNGPNPA